MRIGWGTGVALAYTLFAGATTGLVVFAMHRPVDLVSPDYYARSLRADERLTALANARALGSRFSISREPDALVIAFPSAAAPAGGTVTLYRPSNAHDDRVIPLQPARSGTQRISLAGLARGRWTLQVDWQSDDRQSFYYEQPLNVP